MSADGCTVVFYHYVRDSRDTPYPALNAVSPMQFNEQLDWLATTHEIIDYPRFRALRTENDAGSAQTALLTFDDGFVDHYENVFPRLQERSISGVFFVLGVALANPPRVANVHKTHFLVAKLGSERFTCEIAERLDLDYGHNNARLVWTTDVYRYDAQSDMSIKHKLNYELPLRQVGEALEDLFAAHIGNESEFARELYMSSEMIREMSSMGQTFGFHTDQHLVLSRLSAVEQRKELERGVEMIRKLTAQRSVPFCYPYGHVHTYDKETLRILKQVGYSSAFNTVRRVASPAKDPMFEFPRFDTVDLPPFVSEVSSHA